MGWRVSMVIVALMGFAVPAAAAPVCLTSVGSIPVLDPLSTSAEPGDLTVTCSGLAVGPSLVNVQEFFNTSVVPSGTPTLTTTLGTTYSGTFSGINAVLFTGVSVLGPDFGFTIGDIFVNPSLLGASTPTPILEFVSTSGVPSLPISDPVRTVALVGPIATVPEPGTLMLLGLGFAAWRGARRLRPTIVERR